MSIHPPARTASRLRAALLASVLACMSLVLVFATPNTAAAWATPTPVVIQGALKSPPAQIIRWTPQGRVIGLGIMLGITAYETRGVWMPVLKDLMSPDQVGVATPYPNLDWVAEGEQPCTLTDSFDLKYVPTKNSTTGVVEVTIQARCLREGKSKATGIWEPTLRYTRATAQCENPATGEVRDFTTGSFVFPGRTDDRTANGSSYSYEKAWTFPSPVLCVEGWKPLNVSVTPGSSSIDRMPFLDLVITPDQTYQQTTTVQCKNLATNALQSIATTVKEQPGRIYMPSCLEQLGPGWIPWSGTITKKRGTKAPETVGTFDTDPTKFDQWRDCFGPTGVKCKTEVYVDGQRCVVGNNACADWWRIWRGDPERVDCRFGTHVVPIDHCSPLKRAYGTGSRLDTLEEVEVVVNLNVDPWIIRNPTTNPNPNPTPTPTPTPNPTGSPTITPGPNPEIPETVREDNERSCVQEAVSWNPVQWVYVPVKCAVKWAFVPRTPLDVRVGTISTAVGTKAPFAWLAGIAALPSEVPGGSCPNWNVHVAGKSWSAVCDSEFTSRIVGMRPVFLAMMTATAFWPLIRSTLYAGIPILKPRPLEGR